MSSEFIVSNLTGLFKAEPEDAQDNEKLVDLFRNRAELKKEFAALRDEKYQLQDRIEQHQGATARVQQKMDHLESLLLDREWVHNVVAFYQLRRLAAHCNAKLGRFAEELKQQREQRIHNQALNKWKEQCDQRTAAVQSQISQHQIKTQMLEDQLQSERHKLAAMNGISKMFSSNNLQATIDGITANIEARQNTEAELLKTLQETQEQSAPDHQGLDIATKRSINFMILAFAQQLYLHFEVDDLARLAKEASEKSVGAVNYGTKFECDEIIEKIENRWESMESVTDYAEVLKRRAKFLADDAIFRNDSDVVPLSASTSVVYAIDANGLVRKRDANLLGDNYFGIAKVLSR